VCAWVRKNRHAEEKANPGAGGPAWTERLPVSIRMADGGLASNSNFTANLRNLQLPPVEDHGPPARKKTTSRAASREGSEAKRILKKTGRKTKKAAKSAKKAAASAKRSVKRSARRLKRR
jgi:hypothetical protein